MKMTDSFRKLVCVVAMAIVCLAASQGVSAKYSNACTRFTYDGVYVNVIDRHNEIGNGYDTYGYTEYTNRNDYTVVVNWKAYGVLKSGGKLARVDGGSFKLRPGETRKEVYSYTSPNYSWKDFSKYVVAIDPRSNHVTNNATSKFTTDGVSVEVVDRHTQQGRGVNSYGYLSFKNNNDCKVIVNWNVYGELSNGRRRKVDSGQVIIAAKQSHNEIYQYDGDDDFSNYVADITVTKEKEPEPAAAGSDGVYSRIMKHKQQGNLTEQDYTDALNWMDNQLDGQVGNIYRQLDRLAAKNDEAGVDRLLSQSAAILERFQNIGDIIEDANNAGKLNSAQKSKMQQIMRKIDSLVG